MSLKKSDEIKLKNAIRIVKYAIDNLISIKKSCSHCGYSPTYVKNVKIDAKNWGDSELLREFTTQLDRYGKMRDSDPNFNRVNNVNSDNVVSTETNDDDKYLYTENGDTADLEWVGKGKSIRTLDELLKECKVDTKLWYVDSHVVNKWDVTSWKSGKPQTIENYQVKARLLRHEGVFRAKKASEVFLNLVENYLPTNFNRGNIRDVSVSKDKIMYNQNNLLEISIFDLHLGKLAFDSETGDNYNSDIACERFIYSINTLIDYASPYNIGRVLFPIGSDFFNTDGNSYSTTRGTPQLDDVIWQKSFKLGTEIIITGVERLKKLGVPVDVIVVPGNHDFQRSYYLGSFLDAWYRNDEQVFVNNSESPRKYYRFGDVLLGFTHGDEEKESSLPMIMAKDIDSKKMWSETKFHEWHLGHIHRKRNVNYTVLDKSKTLYEDLGVTIRYLSSLTGTESWHHRKGFIGQTKAADGFVWNDKTGLIAHLNSNIII